MSQAATSFEQREKTAQFIWTGVILAFFLIQAVIWTVAFSVTANDQSHAVVADYDEKALNWDEEKALRASSAALGWSVDLQIDARSDILDFRDITITLQDSGQSAITDATIELFAFHRAQAAKRQGIALSKTEDGDYLGKIQIRKTGLWQFEGTIRRGADTYLIDERHFIKADN